MMKNRNVKIIMVPLFVALIAIVNCDLNLDERGTDGGDADGGVIEPWTSVTKLVIKPDTAAVGDTVIINISIKDSLVEGTRYYWISRAFPFLDGDYNEGTYTTQKGENRVYLSPTVVPNSAFSTDTTILSWRGSIQISNPPLEGGDLQQLFYLKIKKGQL